jgi:aminoglycoside phosphotransferase (APT) family kinase protein
VLTPRPLLESVLRSVCGRESERITTLGGGGLNEAYRVDLAGAAPVVVRVAEQPQPWFADEAHVMAQAHAVGVPTPEVLGVEHLEHDGSLLSFSVQRLMPGRSLQDVCDELPPSEVERLVVDAGELLARVHGVDPDRGMRHELAPLDDETLARITRGVDTEFGGSAAEAVQRAVELLAEQAASRPQPRVRLAHGDWMPKHLLVDGGAIVGVIDWEFAGPASPAFDLARWEVSVGARPGHGSELLWRGYARVADPETAAEGWVPAFAVDWALEVLGWTNPASPAYRRRCLDVVTQHALR